MVVIQINEGREEKRLAVLHQHTYTPNGLGKATHVLLRGASHFALESKSHRAFRGEVTARALSPRVSFACLHPINAKTLFTSEELGLRQD